MQMRGRERELEHKYSSNKLKFDESTYHFSSTEKEKAFIDAQFPTEELKAKYKEYRNEWHRRSDEMDAGEFPLAVICELTSLCNLKCEICYTRTDRFQKMIVGEQRSLSWEIVTSVIDECAELGVYSMLFSWRGESTLYRARDKDGIVRDFADVLMYARRRGILERTSLTNGRALAPPLIEKVVFAEPNWISFSIDGLRETYNKIRKRTRGEGNINPFKVVMGNLESMVRFRNSFEKTCPQIRTNTVYPPIASDPDGYRKCMEAAGVGLVTVNQMLDFRGEEIPDEEIADNWFCQYPFQRLVVSAAGTILPCPGAHGEMEHLVLGRYPGSKPKTIMIGGHKKTIDYPVRTLKEAWNRSSRMKKMRMLHSGNRRKEIPTCKYCRHGATKHPVDWIPEDWDMDKMQWKDKRAWRND